MDAVSVWKACYLIGNVYYTEIPRCARDGTRKSHQELLNGQLYLGTITGSMNNFRQTYKSCPRPGQGTTIPKQLFP
jgi:hypothetical protein